MNQNHKPAVRCPVCMASAERRGTETRPTYSPPGYGMSGGGMLDPGLEAAWGRLGIVPAAGEEPLSEEAARSAPCRVPPIGQSPEAGEALCTCFGTASASSLEELRRCIEAELMLRQELLTLAERSSQTEEPLRNAAAESLESARKLSAAHFLISGAFHWPERILLPAQSGDFASALRRQFSLTQDMESDYRRNGEEAWDRCLGSLYHILADTKVAQSGTLFSVLGSF